MEFAKLLTDKGLGSIPFKFTDKDGNYFAGKSKD